MPYRTDLFALGTDVCLNVDLKINFYEEKNKLLFIFVLDKIINEIFK